MLSVPSLRNVPTHFRRETDAPVPLDVIRSLVRTGLIPATATRLPLDTPVTFVQRELERALTRFPLGSMPNTTLSVAPCHEGLVVAVSTHTFDMHFLDARPILKQLHGISPRIVPSLIERVRVASERVAPFHTPVTALEWVTGAGCDEAWWAQEKAYEFGLSEGLTLDEILGALEEEGVLTPRQVRERLAHYLPHTTADLNELHALIDAAAPGTARDAAVALLNAAHAVIDAARDLPEFRWPRHSDLDGGHTTGYRFNILAELNPLTDLDIVTEQLQEAGQIANETGAYAPNWVTTLTGKDEDVMDLVRYLTVAPRVSAAAYQFAELLDTFDE